MTIHENLKNKGKIVKTHDNLLISAQTITKALLLHVLYHQWYNSTNTVIFCSNIEII